MNKKEIAEIKKLLTPQKCSINKICGCYVNGDKEKVAQFTETFLLLEEEERFKYFEIFRKALSGSIGRSLLNLEFPLSSEREDGIQTKWYALRESSLDNEEMLTAFYDQIISSFDYGENYLILVIDNTYDVPGKSADNLEMYDASDEIYHYQQVCICPVALAKPALSYDAEEKMFRNRMRDWIVGMPMAGFLFPAFNDRSADIHSLLYYTKNAQEIHPELLTALMGTQDSPLPAKSQKQVFTDLVEEVLDQACDYEIVRNLHEQLHELSSAEKESPDPVILDQGEIRNLLTLSGAREEQLTSFDAHYEEMAGPDTQFALSNIVNDRKYEVSTPDVQIRVSADRSDLVETKYIDGRLCLVIPVTDEVHVNGIRVRENRKTEGHKTSNISTAAAGADSAAVSDHDAEEPVPWN